MNIRHAMALLGLLLFQVSALAQVTSVINGKVVDKGQNELPGVVVTIESPQMQGARSTVSRENGQFLFRNIPPGSYVLTAVMEGMQTVKQNLTLNLNQTSRPVIVMSPASAEEEMIVTATVNPILDTPSVAAHLDSDMIDKLPTGRSQESVALLTPGVSNVYTGNLSISGAPSDGNTFLVNGADSRFDNVRGAAANVVIEDAIQETTVITAGVSAEFGQFSGGVVATVTKSGGNEFTGSFRVALSNADWVARNPLELESAVEKDDSINHVETLTLGGPIIKDRLWFFVAGETTELDRDVNFANARAISDRAAESYGLPTGQQVPGIRKVPGRVDERDNYEVKLTGQLFPGHDLIVSYQNREDVNVNNTSSSYDITAAATRTITREAFSANYRGTITDNFSVELIYSDSENIFLERPIPAHLQGLDLRIYGTALQNRTGLAYTNSPLFLGKPDEPRGNEMINAKGNYFLITENLGSHDIVFGVQDSEDIRFVDNRQWVNDWRFRSDFRYEGETAIPIYSPTSSGGRYQSRLYYAPIEISSQTYQLGVTSVYINDSWTLNEKWRFNVGFRYDANKGTNQNGETVTDDNNISPRISATYDLFGDYRHQFSASYSQYVQRAGEAVDDGQLFGNPNFTELRYGGPMTESFLDVIAWLNETYGDGFFLDPLNHPGRAAWEADLTSNELFVPGSPSTVVGSVNPNGGAIIGTVESPSVTETRIGYSTRWGSKGFLKADLILRDFDNFYVSYIDKLTGPTNAGNNDLEVISNDNGEYEREYHAVQIQGEYRFKDNLRLFGNYTWSQLTGNIEGVDSSGTGSTAGLTTQYPEFNNFENRNPTGYLLGDIRHRANIFLVYDMDTSFGLFNFSLSERVTSGSPFDTSWTLDFDEFDGEYGVPLLNSQGYQQVDDTAVYYLLKGGDRAETEYATDLGVNWEMSIFKRVNMFVQIDIYNIFNSDRAGNAQGYRTTINEIAPFNVYTETPVEGIHYEKDPLWGTPTSSTAFQRSRSIGFDLGFRF